MNGILKTYVWVLVFAVVFSGSMVYIAKAEEGVPATVLANISQAIEDIKITVANLQSDVVELRRSVNSVQTNITATEQPISSDTTLFTKRLARRSVDAVEVPRLQECLRNLGYLDIQEFTSFFGVKTEEAVMRFQSDKGLVAYGEREKGSGSVGVRTRILLNRSCGAVFTPQSPGNSPISVGTPAFTTNIPAGPDLIARNLQGTTTGGNQWTLKGTIWNQGTAPANASVTRFRVDHNNNGTWDATVTTGTSALAPGGSEVESWIFTLPQGIHLFEVCADYNNQVPELNENNNCSTKIVVSGPSALLMVSVSPLPPAQSIVGGVQAFTFANYVLDASQATENLRMNSIPLAYHAHGSSIPTNLTGCQLYDGAVPITTGVNVVNPSVQASSTIFTFDGAGLTLTQGTAKTLKLKCNIGGGTTGEYSWGIDSSAVFSATGVSSGQPVSGTGVENVGQKMTVVPYGMYGVVDDSTPGYRIIDAGTTGTLLARLKFWASDESVDVRRVHFQLSNTASNTPADLVNQLVTLYDESAPTIPIATAQFGIGGPIAQDFATSSLITTGVFTVPAGGFKTMLVKGDIAGISVNGPLIRSGDLLRVDYDGTVNGVTNGGNFGIGVSSGVTIAPNSGDTSTQGVRIMKSHPVLTKLSLPTNVLTSGAGRSFYRFSVQAVGGDLRLGKLTFNISSSTVSATTSKYSLYAFDDSAFSNPDTTFSPTGLVNSGQCYGESNNSKGVKNTTGLAGNTDIEIFPTNVSCLTGTTTYRIPAGVTKYFDFQVDVANVETMPGTENVMVTVRGDAAFPTGHQSGPGILGEMGRGSHLGQSIVSVDSDPNDDFIWSPQSTSTVPKVTDFDFTNGYQVMGLPANDMPTEFLVSPN